MEGKEAHLLVRNIVVSTCCSHFELLPLAIHKLGFKGWRLIDGETQ